MGSVSKTRFSFKSDGQTLIGDLYSPKQGAPAGVVVAVGPLTSVKEQAAGIYAQAMAKRGYAALAFDYRTFGESEGSPRQFEDPEANIADIKNAVTALLADERFDQPPGRWRRGLLWCRTDGTCGGRGLALGAFAGVAGVYTDRERTKATIGNAYEAGIERGRAAERRWREDGEAETIPAVGADGGDVAMPLREAYEFYGTPRGQVPNYVNGYAVQSLAYSLPFDAREAQPTQWDVPVILVHSENALAPDLARACLSAVKSPKTRALARLAGPDRLLRRPEAHRSRSRCRSRIPPIVSPSPGPHSNRQLTGARLDLGLNGSGQTRG